MLGNEPSVEIIPIGNRSGAPYLIDVLGEQVDLSSKTMVGEGPFDCGPADASHDIVGLNIVSETYLKAVRLPAPWSATRQRIGQDLNDLRAQRLVLVKAVVRELLISAKVRGVRFEIARMDPQ